MKIFNYCLAIIACASFVSCSSSGVNLPSYDELLKVETQQNGRACIRQHNIRGYGILDDEVVSISASGKNRYYLATTLLQCHSLQMSFAAGFKGGFSEICGGGRDKILTNEESCPIKSIFEFNSREDAFTAFDKIVEIRQELRKEAREKVSTKQIKTAE